MTRTRPSINRGDVARITETDKACREVIQFSVTSCNAVPRIRLPSTPVFHLDTQRDLELIASIEVGCIMLYLFAVY